MIKQNSTVGDESHIIKPCERRKIHSYPYLGLLSLFLISIRFWPSLKPPIDLSSNTKCSWWAATLDVYCPGRVTEHPKLVDERFSVWIGYPKIWYFFKWLEQWPPRKSVVRWKMWYITRATGAAMKGTIHKWRHANFSDFLTPSLPMSLSPFFLQPISTIVTFWSIPPLLYETSFMDGPKEGRKSNFRSCL